MRTTLKGTLLSLPALIFAAPLFAAHPLITDDTGTQGRGTFQIELNSEFSTDKQSENGVISKNNGSAVSASLSAGITDNIDLVVGLPRQWYHLEENGLTLSREQGFGDLSAELKCRLYGNDETGFSFALKPGLTLPTGDETKGLGNGELCGSLMVIATKKGRLGAFHGNVGYTRNSYRLQAADQSSRHDIWHASLAAELNLLGNLRTVANIGIETNESRSADAHPAFIIGGVIYSVSENLDLDLGLKGGLNRAETDRTALAGLTARF